MSRARRVLNAFAVGVLNQMITAVVGLGVTRYALHRIGSHDYGLWIVAGQFLAYLMLLDLGVTSLLPREVALVSGKQVDEAARETEMRGVIGRSIALVLLLVPPLAIASLGILVALPDAWSALRWPLAINLAVFVLTYPFRVASASLSGLQDLTYVAWAQTAAWAVGVVLTVVLVALHFGLYAVAIGPSSTQLLASVLWVARLVQKYPRFVPSLRSIHWFDRAAIRAHLAPGSWVSVGQISQLLINGTDALIIGKLHGPNAVLPYAFTDKTQTLLNNQPFMLAHLAGPALSELRASGDRPRLVRSLGALSSFVLVASGAIFIAIVATNHAFVRLWVGDGLFGGMLLTVLLVGNMMTRHWLFTYIQALFYFGHERAISIILLADGALTVVLMVPLVHFFGAVGAPLAQLISALVTEGPAVLILVARDFECSVRTLVANALPWLARFLPIAVAATAAGRYLGASSLLRVAAAGIVAGLAYAAVMIPFLKKPPLDAYSLPYLRKIGLAPKASNAAP